METVLERNKKGSSETNRNRKVKKFIPRISVQSTDKWGPHPFPLSMGTASTNRVTIEMPPGLLKLGHKRPSLSAGTLLSQPRKKSTCVKAAVLWRSLGRRKGGVKMFQSTAPAEVLADSQYQPSDVWMKVSLANSSLPLLSHSQALSLPEAPRYFRVEIRHSHCALSEFLTY